MQLEAMLGLAAANFVSSLVPGQNTALVAGSAVRYGSNAGLAAICGILIADLAWVFLALMVLDGLLVISPESIAVMRSLGGAILVLIGILVLMSTHAGSAEIPYRFRSFSAYVWTGFLVGIANPMAIIFFLSILPYFVTTGTSGFRIYLNCIMIIMTSSAIALLPYLFFAALAKTKYEKPVSLFCACAIVLFGITTLQIAPSWRVP